MEPVRVSAVMARDSYGRVLVAQRKGKLDGLWEFPGGKQEQDENALECAARELTEELGLSITDPEALFSLAYQQGEKKLLFTVIGARVMVDEPALTLSVHHQTKWVYPSELKKLPLCPADALFVERMGRNWGRVIRPLEPTDALSASKIYALAWKHAYRGIVPKEYLDKLPLDRWEPFLTSSAFSCVVVEQDGELVATSSYAPARDERYAGMGEIISIYALPDAMGQGHGRALMGYVLQQLKKAGFPAAYLWVLAQNSQAIGFYEHMGFAPTGESTSVAIAGKPLTELQYRIAL